MAYCNQKNAGLGHGLEPTGLKNAPLDPGVLRMALLPRYPAVETALIISLRTRKNGPGPGLQTALRLPGGPRPSYQNPRVLV